MKIKYYIPHFNETIEDATELDVAWLGNKSWAEAICQDIYSNRDGFEWMDNGGHNDIVLVCPDGSEVSFTYVIDYSVDFIINF